MATRAARQRNQMPPCYYEGFLEKRSFRDKVPSAEARELWKGFIHSVTELSLPSSLNLLPGQIHMLKEAIEQEKERTKSLPPPAAASSDLYVQPQADMPACYYNVSRLEAMLLLERESEKGNLLLRPGRNGSSFAVTTRQDLDGCPVPHCTTSSRSWWIKPKERWPLSSSKRRTRRASLLFGLIMKTERRAFSRRPSTTAPPAVPPKPVSLRLPPPEAGPVSREDEEPIYLNNSQLEERTEACASLQPRTSNGPGVHASPPDLPPALTSMVADKNSRKKAMIPPSAAPRKLAPPASLVASSSFSSSSSPSSSSASSSGNKPEVRMRVNSDLGKIPMATISELKLKLEKKTRLQD
ncbi:unnamed protein product [Tetraodon nigroviridis]|uniref:(spotted green pufferfish) hypothetical protein n=1 Tax=Tetraodon nigroviridis TaxID=99883 RepID=Q4S3D5_TETNG|nr:unnamed protein product [Tetraodon nigroviridis]